MIQEVPSKVESQHSVNILYIISAFVLFLRDCQFCSLIVDLLSQTKLVYIILYDFIFN